MVHVRYILKNSRKNVELGYISIPEPTLKIENDLKINRGGVVFQFFAEIFGIKYGIRNVLKISNTLNTKYLVGFVAPPQGLEPWTL